MKIAESILTFVFAFVLFAAPAGAEKERFDVGEEVPRFTLKALNADQAGEAYVSIDRYVGADATDRKKALLVSFFATYCEPCKREMPFLGALYSTYKDEGFLSLVVSIDKDADKVEAAAALAKQSNVTFPVLSDRFNIVAKRYFINKLPCVYVLNGDGKVTMVNVGYTNDASHNVLAEVRKLLGESVNAPVPATLAKYMGERPVGDTAAAPAQAQAETVAADKAVAADKPETAKADKKAAKKKRAATKKKGARAAKAASTP
jgi:peroxiredoxin